VTNPNADERDVDIDLFDAEPGLLTGRRGQTIIADKGYASAQFERRLAEHVSSCSAPLTVCAPARPRDRETPTSPHGAVTQPRSHGGRSLQGVTDDPLEFSSG
jgi:hypothetical protein